MKMALNHLFTGPYLDRRADARLQADWLPEARADSGTRYLCMTGTTALVHQESDGKATSIAFLTAADPRVRNTQAAERHILLGWFQEQRCVLIDLTTELAQVGQGEAFVELRPLACDLAPPEAGLLAYARALKLWHDCHRHCSRCGAASTPARAGHARHCSACDHLSFPRLDPAIIVLAHDGDYALLGRQASWPTNRYSTIAGFVEPGESLEDAVHREVHEETGIVIERVSYHSSQPWPFPASLMLGFTAAARRGPITLHDGELEDARWFSRHEFRSGTVLLPPHETISRQLIEHWLANGH
jgi:NAD+ diphosphatase